MEIAEIKEEKKIINQKTVRFSDAIWYKPGISVIIGGVGSIGSHLSYYLGRQECDMYLYDMDSVDEVNLAEAMDLIWGFAREDFHGDLDNVFFLDEDGVDVQELGLL